MIATILSLSRADCKAFKINDAYSLHKVVYSLFPIQKGKTRDFLYVDKGGDWHYRIVLILSKREPQQPEYGQIEFKPVPDSFLQKDHYGFEVVLNPTKRDNHTGKITAIRGREHLSQWFHEKSGRLGVEVIERSLQVNRIGVVTYNKNGTTRTHNSATFIGKLKVTDRQTFINSFEKGIGRAKGFGFGLLQIVPIAVSQR